MNTLCLLRMGKLSAIVRLDHIRCIAEIDDRSLHKIHGAITAVLLIGIDKSFSGGFLYHGILVEFFTIYTHIADDWHIFHIHLPLFAQFCGCIIVPQMLGFFLGRFYLLAVAEPDKHTIQRARVPAVCLLLTQFAIQLANADIGVTAMIVSDPSQFLLRVGLGVRTVRTMGFRHERFLCAVILLVPAHEGGFGYMIPAKNKVDIFYLPVQLYGIDLCSQFMW